MRYFDYSFLEYGMIPARLVNIVSSISQLRERETEWQTNFDELFVKLESIAKVQSVKGSNEIEGIVTSDQRINEIVNQNSAPLNHNEAEIAGYRDALNLIHQEGNRFDIRESNILQLHEILLSYLPITGGHYKKNDNVIMEISEGVRRVRFSPVTAAETADAMKQLILAYMDARNNYNINQLLLIPCFILDFLCIHPFADGNGRMSRLISLLLLYKNGFDIGRYISFEEQINRMKASYYQALKESSLGWHEGNNNYFPFIENFVSALLLCYKELDKRFAVINSKKISKRRRIEAAVINNLLPISKQEIAYILPDVSASTIEFVLGEMVRNRQIEKVGAARNIKYIRKQD